MSMELIEQTAVTVRRMLRRGEVTPVELLAALETRIAAVDPTINALPTRCFARASAQAQSLPVASLLGGIPVAIKDLTDLSGVRTTYGSRVYENHVPARSDLLVQRLERHGGIPYAKSNTPEFGTGANTVNFVFGATRNPWNTALSVAGSSGGSAAALATGMAWLATGSDMGGSLRNPASFCAIVGMRPTIGRVAATPNGALLDTLGTHGPMARNVADLALLFDAMCGREAQDPLSLPDPGLSFLERANAPKKPEKIAFSPDLGFSPLAPEVRTVIRHAIDRLADAGLDIVEASPDFSGLHDIFDTLRAYHYATRLGPLTAQHGDQLHPNVRWNIRQGQALTLENVARAEAERLRLVQRVQRFFQQYPLLLCPATIVPPYPVTMDHVTECDGHTFANYYQWLGIAYSFTVALCPALSLPCGFTSAGLPVGLQIAAATWEDARVIEAAACIEQLLNLNTGIPISPDFRF